MMIDHVLKQVISVYNGFQWNRWLIVIDHVLICEWFAGELYLDLQQGR